MCVHAHVIRCVALIASLLCYREVTSGERYEYEVSVRGGGDGGVSSLPSPRLTYTHGASFCGDGRVESSGGAEQCDDGNLRDGDGCSLGCRIERFFHCIGTRRARSVFFFSKKTMTSLFCLNTYCRACVQVAMLYLELLRSVLVGRAWT